MTSKPSALLARTLTFSYVARIDVKLMMHTRIKAGEVGSLFRIDIYMSLTDCVLQSVYIKMEHLYSDDRRNARKWTVGSKNIKTNFVWQPCAMQDLNVTPFLLCLKIPSSSASKSSDLFLARHFLIRMNCIISCCTEYRNTIMSDEMAVGWCCFQNWVVKYVRKSDDKVFSFLKRFSYSKKQGTKV